ncbi:MAG: cyclic nucleotide-binding domain-containing protein [Acidobacteria bacterium]|nr:cyclic nucleotide-binding domain-containing protein [Acidobacteriota bacterium]MCZ6725881.1 cyclic nucleotide-binding domain-containing protein [Acidobacteriota bacterium]
MSKPELGKTDLKQIEQYRDRWSSLGAHTGLVGISDQLTVEQLREHEIFRELGDRVLKKISQDVTLATWKEGAVLFEEGTYIDLAFLVLDGEVEVFLEGVESTAYDTARPIFDLSRTVVGSPTAMSEATAARGAEAASRTVMMRPPSGRAVGEITFLASMDFDLPRGGSTRLGPGEFFGEIGALSGWPQSVTARTASACRLIQIRTPALRLLKRKSKALKEQLDSLYRQRSLAAQLKSTPLFNACSNVFVEALKEVVELVSCDSGEVIAEEGSPADAFYLVRSGFVKLLQNFGDGEMVVSYLSKGMTLGEAELLIEGVDSWQVTAVSVESSELVRIPRRMFTELVRSQPEMEEQLWRSAAERIKEAGLSRRNISYSEFTQVALDNGLVQGNSILAIDLNACTRCDDCVRACADTHGGRPRFVREGSKYRNLLIAKSCYHCRDPVCLVGCPTGAIHRAGAGDEVVIDEEICIGCATCYNNCPYDAIIMHETGVAWPVDALPAGLRGKDQRLASKCDLCVDTGHGPACVSNCPQGCAYRVGSIEEFERLLERTS